MLSPGETLVVGWLMQMVFAVAVLTGFVPAEVVSAIVQIRVGVALTERVLLLTAAVLADGMVVKLVFSADVLRGGVLAGALSTSADLTLGMAEGMALMMLVAAPVLAWVGNG